MSYCARRSRAWRTAALWRSGGRSHEPHGFAFQQKAVWCGARGRAVGLARSSFYAARHRKRHPREEQKRGPKVLSDAELVTAIRQLLDEAVFSGEGYRKIWARLRHNGIRTSKDRVLQLLRENQLLSPARAPEPARSNPHEGTIKAR